MLPEYTVPWGGSWHEAELALVNEGPGQDGEGRRLGRRLCSATTTLIDVVRAREQGRRTWPATPLNELARQVVRHLRRRSAHASPLPTR